MSEERSLPHSIEAEKGLLGSMAIAPNWIATVAREMPLEAFYFPAHKALAEAMVGLQNDGVEADFPSILAALRSAGKVEEVGGPVAVSDIFQAVPTAANARYYLDSVLGKYRLRQLIADATALVQEAYEPAADPEQMEAKLAALATERAARGSTRRKARSFGDLMLGAVERMEERFKRRGTIAGIPSGFPDLDRQTDGWKPGQMIVVGAIEKQGKSTLTRHFAVAAAKAGKKVLIISLEMSDEEIADAALATEAKLNTMHLTMSPDSWNSRVFDQITSAAAALGRLPIRVIDEGAATRSQVVSAVRNEALTVGVGLVIIDYLQLIEPDKRGAANREQEVSEAGRTIKTLAKELQVPIIVPIQLNEDGLARESRAIQMHCDKFLRIIHEDWEGCPDGGKAWLKIKNQRGGGRSAVPVTWMPETTTFLPRSLNDGDSMEPPAETPKKKKR